MCVRVEAPKRRSRTTATALEANGMNEKDHLDGGKDANKYCQRYLRSRRWENAARAECYIRLEELFGDDNDELRVGINTRIIRCTTAHRNIQAKLRRK